MSGRALRRALLAGAAIAVAALGPTACGGPDDTRSPATDSGGPLVTWREATGPPDALLITLDTLRSDRAGCLGHPGGLTPTVDRLLRTGVLARNAFAPAPLTAVSHATILTGLEPPTHGVRENGMFRLGDEPATLAGVLREAGWRTAAVVAALPVTSRFGFERGFDTFDEDLRMPDSAVRYYAERPAAAVVDVALTWLEGLDADERWFLWAHFFDPHHPHDPPAPLRSLPADSDYDREIRAMDFEIRRLVRGVEARGGGRPPVVAVVSDHGEGLGDHRESSHGILVHTETMHGLLGFAAPAGTPEADRLGHGLRVAPASYADVLPTLLDVLEVEVPEDVEGRSWIDPSARPDGVYGETYYPMIHYGWSPLLSWRDERWTYVEGPSPELFDREADPAELRNVIDGHPEVAERFARRLAAIARDPEPPEESSLDEETREQLLALGYVSGDAQTADRTKDPKELIDVVNLLFRGLHYLGEGKLDSALALLQRAYRLDPDNVSVLFNLADCLRRSGDAPTALAYYHRAVRRDPRAAEAWAHLASLTFETGDRQRALDLVDEGLGHSPTSIPLLLTAGDLRFDSGDREAAGGWYRRAREAEPENPDPWVALARLAEAEGRAAEAEELWAEVIARWPKHPGLPPRLRGAGAAP